MLPPLVSLAVSLLPNLAKRVADNVIPGVEQKLSNTVSEFLGTDDVEIAQEKLQDPKVAAELRVKLAEIEVEADRVEAAREAKRRETELDTFKQAMEDTKNARASMVELAKEGSALHWAPAAVSLVVIAGFFGALYFLISLMDKPVELDVNGQPLQNNVAVIQIVNIAVGTLTAGFATVISFWLGSSQGSRNKDDLNAKSQSAVAQIQAESAQVTKEMVSEQGRQTSDILQKMASIPAAAAAPPAQATADQAKPPRQFQACLDVILKHEGGFANHPNDPGGATNMGITHKTLASWREVDAVSIDDVRNLKIEEVREIYRVRYWNALNCDQLPVGIDLVVFDFGVNAGPGQSARTLQDILAVKADGQVGPVTLGAARTCDREFTISQFSEDRLKFYQGLPGWGDFGKGWSVRTAEVKTAALKMLQA